MYSNCQTHRIQLTRSAERWQLRKLNFCLRCCMSTLSHKLQHFLDRNLMVTAEEAYSYHYLVFGIAYLTSLSAYCDVIHLISYFSTSNYKVFRWRQNILCLSAYLNYFQESYVSSFLHVIFFLYNPNLPNTQNRSPAHYISTKLKQIQALHFDTTISSFKRKGRAL